MMRATSPSICLLSVFVHPPCSLHALGYVQCEPMHTHWCKLLLLGNNLRKEQQEKWHLTSCLQASGKWASGSCKGKKTSQEQPHPHHPKLEAAPLGLLHLRHFSHCAQVRLLAPVPVSSSSHATTWASTTNPFPNHLAIFCTTLTKSNSSPMSPASSMSTASSYSSSASASAMSAATASSTNSASSD